MRKRVNRMRVWCLWLAFLVGQGCTSLESGAERVDVPCGLSFEEGNGAVTGVGPADNYLWTVRNFVAEYQTLGTAIENELRSLKEELSLSPEAIAEKGSLALAISKKFQDELHAPLHVYGRQARCAPDVRQALLESALCQEDVGCREVSLAAAEGAYRCLASCEVQARSALQCGADTRARCRYRGLGLACTGTCAGFCRYTSTTTEDCPGSCLGTCDGACEQPGDGNKDGQLSTRECAGRCVGTCSGTCEVESQVGRACAGTCDGECTSSSATSMDCTGADEAECWSLVGESLVCSERCFGDFREPEALASCTASAMCSAQARARAVLLATCEPPDVELQVSLMDDLSESEHTEVQFARSALARRLPMIMGLVARTQPLDSIGSSLIAGTVGVKERMLFSLVEYSQFSPDEQRRILECAQPAFDQAGQALQAALETLGPVVAEAASLQTDLVTLN